jgi:hypothetical protein
MWNVHAKAVWWNFFAMKQKLLIYFIRHNLHPVLLYYQGPSESCTPHSGHRNNSSPALPVLRHLRPEFRAQLSLGSAAKKLHVHSAGTSADEETRASISKR